ncbi:hypothetical protein AAVH_29447, partial [Aphelenchoides avenae]
MLPEIAAEALCFLSRRDLDRACAVSKWLDALIAQCCSVYPLRQVFEVEMRPCRKEFRVTFGGYETKDSMKCHTFVWLNEAVDFTGSTLRNSYVKNLK